MTPTDAYLLSHYQDSLNNGEPSFIILKDSLNEYTTPTQENIKAVFARNGISVYIEEDSAQYRIHIL